jgi:hypothetical protein
MRETIDGDAHRKIKGSFGELKVAADLVRQGYSVFTEMGDNAKVDLIVLVENVAVKLQVKCYASSNGVVSVYGRKTGPNYRYRYQREHVDVFAVYVYDRDKILYISASDVVGHGRIKIRFDAPKNEQKRKIRWHRDYLDFRESLRDYTPGTLT